MESLLLLTMLLRYRPVIGFGRPGGALLVGLTAGALLVGTVAVAAPAGVLPASWATALGSATIDPPPPTTTRAAPRTRSRVARPALPAPTTTTPATSTAVTTTTPPITTSAVPTTTSAASTTTTEPDPAPRPAPVPGGTTDAVVALTNDARAGAGCPPLRTDSRLTAAAQGHSEDMAANGYFSHDSRDGRGFDDRIRDTGHPSPGGENIAQGQESAAEVVQAWMNSPGHRRNIENCSFTGIGVGLDPRGNYWTQDFGR